jgi:CheY-like chemotaxis protein
MGQSRAVLIVEDDAELRSLLATLLEDGQPDIIECESAEAALATTLIRGREVAMIFRCSASRRYERSGLSVGGEDALAISPSDPHVRASAQANR